MNILICGVGAIGSNLASILVPDLKGDHDITILDRDSVEIRNIEVGTQFFTPDQVGMKKVEALQYNLYKWFNREVESLGTDISLEPLVLPKSSSDWLMVDCFDNHTAREIIYSNCQTGRIPCLHVGFSDQFTFAIEWNENYKVPTDITSGLDICEMEGAASFVKMVASVGSLAVQEFVRNQKKFEFVGNRYSVHQMI